MNLIASRFLKFRSDTMSSWEDILWICLTADIWTCHKQGFFGVTAHWLDKNLNRVSVAIAIQRFKGDFNSIAKEERLYKRLLCALQVRTHTTQ